jgi:hypothetical protein
VAYPSRLAVKNGEHLRMTVEYLERTPDRDCCELTRGDE